MASPPPFEPLEAPLQTESRSSAIEAMEDIGFGSIAGIVGKYIEYPFDTVKVRLQSSSLYSGPVDCIRKSIKADGVLGLYRGISAPLVGAAAETSSLFFFERIGRELVFKTGVCAQGEKIPLSALWFTGAFSGVFTSFVLTPIELVKCKIQVPDTAESGVARAPLRPVPVIRDIWRHEGLRGFWHGQLGTLIREAGGCAAWFGGKETTTELFYGLKTRKASSQAEIDAILAEPLPLWQQAVAGASAGVSYNFLFFPADTVKSRMQTAPIGGTAPNRTFLQEGVSLWNQAGLRGFYRGCGITCMRSAPSSAFIFMIYDGLKRHFSFQ